MKMTSRIQHLHKLPSFLSCQPFIDHPPFWMCPHHIPFPRTKWGLMIPHSIDKSLTEGALLERVRSSGEIQKSVWNGDVGDADRYRVRVSS
jgi:hypothetical protein